MRCRWLSSWPRSYGRRPRKIAEEIVGGIGPIPGFEKLELAGAGYINARLKREELAAALVADEIPGAEIPAGKILVEHSSINPNKAAHVGHLRNAILGDTFVRLLRFAGREVDVQNYIDNTGVQVADVVVGFLAIEKKSRAEIELLSRQSRFDYYCWDLYARVAHWYAEDKQNLQARQQALHAIEEGNNESAAVADVISIAVLRRHLETMERLSYRVRLSAARERDSPPPFLGCSFHEAEGRRRPLLRDRRQEQGLLGDAAGGNGEN